MRQPIPLKIGIAATAIACIILAAKCSDDNKPKTEVTISPKHYCEPTVEDTATMTRIRLGYSAGWDSKIEDIITTLDRIERKLKDQPKEEPGWFFKTYPYGFEIPLDTSVRHMDGWYGDWDSTTLRGLLIDTMWDRKKLVPDTIPGNLKATN